MPSRYEDPDAEESSVPRDRRRYEHRLSDSPEVGKAKIDLDKLEVERALKIQEENWIKTYWRPGMGWLYMLICFVDFVFFPLLAMFIPGILKALGVENTQYIPWVSLTLSNGGLIHLAFGAILGVTAWTRGMEKMQRN